MAMSISGTCKMCKEMYYTKPHVLLQDIEAYKKGALAQEAFPNLSADDREFIISGICPECFNNLFEEEDDA